MHHSLPCLVAVSVDISLRTYLPVRVIAVLHSAPILPPWHIIENRPTIAKKPQPRQANLENPNLPKEAVLISSSVPRIGGPLAAENQIKSVASDQSSSPVHYVESSSPLNTRSAAIKTQTRVRARSIICALLHGMSTMKISTIQAAEWRVVLEHTCASNLTTSGWHTSTDAT